MNSLNVHLLGAPPRSYSNNNDRYIENKSNNKYVDTLNKMGLNEYMKVYSDAYERYSS